MQTDILPADSQIIQNVLNTLMADNEPTFIALIADNIVKGRYVLEAILLDIVKENVVYDGEDNCPLIAYFGNSKYIAELKEKLDSLYSMDSSKLHNLHDYSVHDSGIINPEVAVIDILATQKYDYIFLDVGMNLYENENGVFDSTFLFDLDPLRKSTARIIITAWYEQEIKDKVLEDNIIHAVFLD